MSEKKTNQTHIISVLNHKGGVGKTTVTLNLAGSLKADGYKVLAIDFDSQGNLSKPARTESEEFEYTIENFLKGDVKLEEVMIKHHLFDLIPADIRLNEAELWLNAKAVGKEACLKKVLAPIKDRYDFIFIDNQPHLGALSTNSLMASDYYLVVVATDDYSRHGTKNLMDYVNIVSEYHPSLKMLGVIANRFDARRTVDQQCLESFRSAFQHPIEPGKNYMFKTVIRNATAIIESPMYKKTVIEYEPDSSSADQYRQFIGEVLDRLDIPSHA